MNPPPPPTTYLRLELDNPMSTMGEQTRAESSPLLTNLTLSCDDGYMDIHRCLLANASPLIQTLLINEDPSLPSFIHVEGYSMSTVRCLMSLMYTGKATVIGAAEQGKLHNLMQTLGFPVTSVLYKPSNHRVIYPSYSDLFRCVTRFPGLNEVDSSENEKSEDDKENNEDVESESGSGMPPPKANMNDLAAVRNIRSRPKTTGGQNYKKTALNNVEIVAPTKETIPSIKPTPLLPNPVVEPTPCSELPSTSQSSTATASSTASMKRDTTPEGPIAPNYGWGELRECCSCYHPCDSELELVEHLLNTCASSLKGYFNYDKKSCTVCERNDFPNLFECLAHIEACYDWKHTPPSSPKSEPSTSPKTDRIHRQSRNSSDVGPDKIEDVTHDPEPTEVPDDRPPLRKRLRPNSKSKILNKEDETRKMSPQRPSGSEHRRASKEFSTEEEPSVDPDLVRKQLGITSASDITSLPPDKLHQLFHICPFPLCKKQHHRVIALTTCIRNHGYRYCWVCLKLFPNTGFTFDAHNTMEHCIRHNSEEDDDDDEEQVQISNKVQCPFCTLPLEYKNALPVHMGSVHSHQLMYGEVHSASASPTTTQASSTQKLPKPMINRLGKQVRKPRIQVAKKLKIDVDTPQEIDHTETEQTTVEVQLDQADANLNPQDPKLNCEKSLGSTDKVGLKHTPEIDDNLRVEDQIQISQEAKTSQSSESTSLTQSEVASTLELEVLSNSRPTTPDPSSPKKSASSSPYFPARFSRNGEWKFVREQRFGEAIYGMYINSIGKVIGVPSSQVNEIKQQQF